MTAEVELGKRRLPGPQDERENNNVPTRLGLRFHGGCGQDLEDGSLTPYGLPCQKSCKSGNGQ